MSKRGVGEWVHQPTINQILLCFSAPKTPREVEKELGIKKLKLKPYLDRNLLKSLNPGARKGRFYILTGKARRLLKLSGSKKGINKDWHMIGWINASPRQRLVVLKAMDSEKRTSEEIRERALKFNPHLTRISTKSILKELISRGLVETEILNRRRYYWLSERGKLFV